MAASVTTIAEKLLKRCGSSVKPLIIVIIIILTQWFTTCSRVHVGLSWRLVLVVCLRASISALPVSPLLGLLIRLREVIWVSCTRGNYSLRAWC